MLVVYESDVPIITFISMICEKTCVSNIGLIKMSLLSLNMWQTPRFGDSSFLVH